MIHVYCSSGFKFMDRLVDLVDSLKSRSTIIESYFQFHIPQLIEDTKHHSYVYSDIITLKKCDILLAHIPQATVGSCCELGFFRAIKPHNPIIAYQCTDHPWIKHLSNFFVDSIDDVIDILETLYLSKST